MDSVVEAIRRHLRQNPGNNLIYSPPSRTWTNFIKSLPIIYPGLRLDYKVATHQIEAEKQKHKAEAAKAEAKWEEAIAIENGN